MAGQSGIDPGADHVVRVAALSYGPHAVARLHGKVVFVRGAAPGDEVRIRIREQHRSFAFADVVAVLQASPDRRQPPCPYLPRCGGCPWQHIAYPAQLRTKEEIVRGALQRAVNLSGAEWRQIVPSPVELGYRHRLSLRVAERQLGFFAGGSHELVPVARCLLGEGALEDAIPIAAEWVSRLHSAVTRVEILVAQDARLIFAAEASGTLAARDDVVSKQFLASRPRVAGLVLRGRRTRRAWGDERSALEIGAGLACLVRANTFTQVSRAGNRLLVEAVLRDGEFQDGQHVLDLFAGAGNLTLPIARRVERVVAVERAKTAAEDGVANARGLGLANCEFRFVSAAAAVRRSTECGERFDVVVLDPPRSGAAEVIPHLLRLGPMRIVYVSCHPATLARDLGRLAGRYRILAVQPIDLFPQTYHVETVVTAALL